MSDQYYYATDGKRAGPVSFAQLQQLATNGELNRRDKVWCKWMKEWQSAEAVANLFDELPPDLESATTSEVPPPLPPVDLRGDLEQNNLWTMKPSPAAESDARGFMKFERQSFIVGYPTAFVLALVAGYFSGAESAEADGFSVAICLLLATGATIVAYWNWMRIHHRFWKLIPPALAATSPNKAVGFYFVPLYNIYWAFVTFNALARNANTTLAALGENNVRCNEGLALAFSIVQAVLLAGGAAVPVLGILLLVAAYILWIVWYADLTKACAIFERHAPKTEPALAPIPRPVSA